MATATINSAGERAQQCGVAGKGGEAAEADAVAGIQRHRRQDDGGQHEAEGTGSAQAMQAAQPRQPARSIRCFWKMCVVVVEKRPWPRAAHSSARMAKTMSSSSEASWAAAAGLPRAYQAR